jgi:predicted ATPase/class 3 adenylate cyclase
MTSASPLPTGTLTFLFTDLEGSTRLLQAVGPAYGDLLAVHRELIRGPVRSAGGVEFGTEGDAVVAEFTSAAGAVAGAAAAQRALAPHPWPPDAVIRVRMGVHTGEATLLGNTYVGLDLHRVARITAAGHGGQVLVSDATVRLVADGLPGGVTTRDLGERRLKDLARPERIFQLVIDGLPADFPPLKTLDRTPNNLPTQLTSFVGREQEVAAARALLEKARLLTLTGPGGTGKTRLSLQVAAEVAGEFPDGAFFVPLDAVTDPTLVASAIVSALGLQEAGQRTPRERLLEYVADRSILLVLDNFEQVLDAAPLVAEVLRASPRSRVIVSSRAVLHVQGEQEFAVPPVGDAEAIALFVERASAVRADFCLTDDNAATIAAICRRLDGLPLAIELAAARIKLLPPDAILARLDGRLSLLASSARDLPERQQTLRGAIDWSYHLLDDGSRRLLARFSVFAGSAALEEAEAVCGPASELDGEVFDGLAALVDQSLLRQVETAGDPRFQMLQTIRDYGAERLAEHGERTAIRDRHAAAYLALARHAEPFLTGRDQRIWLDRLEREVDNLRLAIGWFVEQGRVADALEMGGASWRFWQMRGYLLEGAERMQAILALPGAADDPVARRRGLDAAAGLAYWRGDLEAAKARYAEATSLARAGGDKRQVAEALYNESFPWMITLADVPRAAAMAREALALYREVGDREGAAKALWSVGNAEYFAQRYEAAVAGIGEALAAAEAIGDPFGVAWASHTLGLALFQLGRYAEARAHWVTMLQIFQAAEDVSGIGTALANFRTLAVQAGDRERALRLAGASSAIVQRSGADLADIITQIEGRADDRAPVDEPAAARLWAAGAAMPLAEAIAYALEDAAAPVGARP